MIKSIFITGIAGSGKTSVSTELIKRGYKAYNIEEIEGLFEMRDKRTGKLFENYDNYDFEKVKYHDWFCNKNKLQKLIQKNKKDIAYYCGIASNNDEILPLFDKVILLQASSEVIIKRLSERKNNDFGKTIEVREMVLSGKDHFENRMKEKGAIVVDANRGLGKVADDIMGKIEKNNKIIQQNRFKEILIYTAPNGKVNIEVFLHNENIWLTQAKIATLFGVDRTVITKHLQNIYETMEFG